MRPVMHVCTLGWDFSSRWLSSADDLASIRASDIVPADLNAILVDYDRNLAFIADKGE